MYVQGAVDPQGSLVGSSYSTCFSEKDRDQWGDISRDLQGLSGEVQTRLPVIELSGNFKSFTEFLLIGYH